MAKSTSRRSARAERERARLYRARIDLHERQTRRRIRDNVLAGVGGGLLVAGLVAIQTLYFVVGTGTAQQAATSTPIPTLSSGPASSQTPVPSATTAG